MNRAQLEHIIRAAADIADDDEIVIVGSQSVLGSYPNAPANLLVSVEADVYPKNHPERWELVDGSIGELSPFHRTFGYYAQGVEPGTAVLPEGWEDRVVVVSNPNTRGAKGLCLDFHDLAVSKYIAFREKDFGFIRTAIRHGMLDHNQLRARLAKTPCAEDKRKLLSLTIDADFGVVAGSVI